MPKADSGYWKDLSVKLHDYVDAMAELARHHPPKIVPVMRWHDVASNPWFGTENEWWFADEVGYGMYSGEAYDALNAALRAVPEIRDVFDGHVMAGDMGLWIDVQAIAAGALRIAVHLDREGHVVVNEAAVAKHLEALRGLVTGTQNDVEALYFVEGVAAIDPVDLDDKTTLQRMQAEDLETFIAAGACPLKLSATSTPEKVRVEALYARPPICLRITLPSSSAQPYVDQYALAQVRYDRFADSCALAVGSRPILIACRRRSCNPLLQGSFLMQFFSSADQERRTATIGDPNTLTKIYRQVGLAEQSEPSTRLAVRRLGFAKERESLDDKLVDVVIALETLLLSDQSTDRGELALRAGLRASQWAADELLGVTPIEAYDLVREAYARRSALVHGGVVRDEKPIRVAGAPTTLEALVAGIDKLGIAIARSTLTRLELSNPKYDWTERMRRMVQAQERNDTL